ncbi:MAG: helix-turn-helix domain-containing protein [Candidatus Kapabacteria bacterium]|nr:helix-turn-helix domain-containing protein [Candidatus Kapabacteria bacterium]
MNQMVYTTETAAKWFTERGLRASSQQVRLWIKKGLLSARWWGKGYIMTEEDLMAFLSSHVIRKETK